MSIRLLAFVALVVAVIVSAIGVVHTRHQHRQLFVELTRLQNERDELNIDFGRLQLEQATWAETGRVERIARNRLGMVTPAGESLVVVKP